MTSIPSKLNRKDHWATVNRASQNHKPLGLRANPMRLQSFAWLALVSLTLVGCQSSAETDPIEQANSEAEVTEETNRSDSTSIDHLAVAREKLSRRLWDAAAKAASQALLQDPNNHEATLIAAKAEFGRGDNELAIQYASGIPNDSRLIREAIDVQVESMYRLRKFAEAAELLEDAIDANPTNWLWRHRAWQLLNRIGKREQASLQAEMLCRAGEATESELNSLMRRTDAFPTVLPTGEQIETQFAKGLGVARWQFTQGEYRTALNTLQSWQKSNDLSPAGQALVGRLLGETQSIDEFPAWHSKIDPEALDRFGDYWAALGIYFFDRRNYETTARCLLEAIRRNPTDRRTMQRLAKVFDALGQAEQAEQYRRRGVAMAQTEATSDNLQALSRSANRDRLEIRKELMRQTLELERPFESLGWAGLIFPSSAFQQLQNISQQRNALLASADARSMSRQAAMIGADLQSFSLGIPYDQLTANQSTSQATPDRLEVKPIATPALINVASNVGLDFQWYTDEGVDIESIPIHESIGGGIAVIDYDQDGWPDLYFAQGSGEPPTNQCTRTNLLSRNQQGFFNDVTLYADTENRHYGSGISAGDINQDGWMDLYVGSLGTNRILINNGDGTFRDATLDLGENTDQFTTSLGIADLDGDALPDLFESIYIEMEGAFALPEIGEDGKEVQPSPLEFYAESDRWFKNLGDGTFEMQSIPREDARPGTSLGLIITNFDNQPGNEIFVGNDVRPNHFLRHRNYTNPPQNVQAGENRLLNSADALGLANGFSGAANGCMGIAAGDYNRDGKIDLHITNFNAESANLYLQNQAGGFTDFATRYQLDTTSTPYVGFGTKAVDFDCDGWLDLAVTNGHIFDMSQYGEGFQMPPQLLMNFGSRFELTEVQDESGYWSGEYLGRSMVSLDFNRDHLTDLIINHLDQPAALLENQTDTPGKSLELELIGTSSERDAIGTRVTLSVSDNQATTAWVTAGDGYLCSDEPTLKFGLGMNQDVDSLVINWPSGKNQTFRNVASGRYLAIEGQEQLFTR